MTREEAKEFLIDISYKLGNMSIEYLTEKAGEEIRKAIEILEHKSCEDAVSRQILKEQMIKYGFHAPDMTVTEFVEDLQPVNPQPKTGHWIYHEEKMFGCAEHWECSQCHRTIMTNPFSVNGNDYDAMYYCPKCGKKMQTESEDKG